MGTEVRDRAYEAQLIAAYPVHPEYPAFCIERLRVLHTSKPVSLMTGIASVVAIQAKGLAVEIVSSDARE